MLHRQRTRASIETGPATDQSSIRIIESGSSFTAVQASGPASQRQVQLGDRETRRCDIDQASQEWARFSDQNTITTLDAGSVTTVFTSADSSESQADTLDTAADPGQSVPLTLPRGPVLINPNVWSTQNSRVADTLFPRPLETDIESAALSASGRPVQHQPVAIGFKVDQLRETHVQLRAPARVLRDLKQLADSGTGEGWRCGLSSVRSLDDFIGFFSGNPNSPYEGGIFYVRFHIPGNYPMVPPTCQLLTKIYHPNFDARGRICVDLLYSGWTPILAASGILTGLSTLLSRPSFDDPLVPEIAEQARRDPARYVEIAKQYTQRYATGALPEVSDVDGRGQPWWTDVRISRD